jgi:hypothetical protein
MICILHHRCEILSVIPQEENILRVTEKKVWRVLQGCSTLYTQEFNNLQNLLSVTCQCKTWYSLLTKN